MIRCPNEPIPLPVFLDVHEDDDPVAAQQFVDEMLAPKHEMVAISLALTGETIGHYCVDCDQSTTDEWVRG